MTNVLCWPLEEAVVRLEAEGFRVELEEAKPRKERPAGQRRVVRQAAEGLRVELSEAKPRKERPAGQRRVVRQEEKDGVCRLTWSNFKA